MHTSIHHQNYQAYIAVFPICCNFIKHLKLQQKATKQVLYKMYMIDL